MLEYIKTPGFTIGKFYVECLVPILGVTYPLQNPLVVDKVERGRLSRILNALGIEWTNLFRVELSKVSKAIKSYKNEKERERRSKDLTLMDKFFSNMSATREKYVTDTIMDIDNIASRLMSVSTYF